MVAEEPPRRIEGEREKVANQFSVVGLFTKANDGNNRETDKRAAAEQRFFPRLLHILLLLRLHLVQIGFPFQDGQQNP